MALKKDSSSPKKGMNRDKAVFDLDKMEYSFALNANFHDEHGRKTRGFWQEPNANFLMEPVSKSIRVRTKCLCQSIKKIHSISYQLLALENLRVSAST